MGYEYFYGPQADQFSFYRVPKILFAVADFDVLSAEAKLLYGIMLERMNLSARNGWFDEEGKVYIIITIKELMDDLRCSDRKAGRMLSELEEAGLIERKRQGLGKPNLIYVKNFIQIRQNCPVQNRKNADSGIVETQIQETAEIRSNNKDLNNTDHSDKDLIHLSGRNEKMGKRTEYREYFEQALELPLFRQNHPYRTDIIDEIAELLVDACCTTAATIRISGDEKPAEVVKSRFMKLDSTHLDYVLECIDRNTTEVRNIKQYLLATLYNAPMTIGSYYNAQVRHDLGPR